MNTPHKMDWTVKLQHTERAHQTNDKAADEAEAVL